MDAVMEHYGAGLLQLLGGVGMFAIIGAFLQSGGSVYLWIVQYLHGIAG